LRRIPWGTGVAERPATGAGGDSSPGRLVSGRLLMVTMATFEKNDQFGISSDVLSTK
jgi:hypothetical protein